ncbi:ankyrin repeat and death domain-containing protein 1A-like isoform X1 [Acipenser oxyrinchus oxyrinchus]|uniref:Ankyrin repeat and death domain-containing protein 1A-like isoform X1 n=1 Tax=Acipenser oxyrinchus oxyrinchus TaxID=40147 RepID=A0AAD8CH56_ACIOX|nr:ankyrin repeat and death domain-containing protein 1A-like isoform X1 [Acipenser oxyrinchus oxyrinchus]
MEVASTLRDKMKKISDLKKENLNPKNWVKADNVKRLKEKVLHSDTESDTDKSFDNKEMLLQIERDFIEAARRNDVPTMKILEKNVNINARNVNGRTALHFAVAGKHKEPVELLLRRKARVDTADKHGITALHLAAWFGCLDIMTLLVQAGAEQKALNLDGMNIMHCASLNNNTAIVKYIIDDLQMKQLDKPGKSNKKPFHLAAEHGCLEMVEMMMGEEYNLSTKEKDQDDNTALHLAAKNGHIEVIKLLLDSFEEERNEVNEVGEFAGKTALYLASEGGYYECVEVLLEAGCDVNIVTKNGNNVLHGVSESGHASLVKLLIDNRADMNCLNDQKLAPIHLAVTNCHIPVIHTFIESGCDMNATDSRNQTALHIAAELGKADIVEMILKAGADLSIQDKQGKTALAVAGRGNYVNIVDMIIKAERYFEWKKANAETNETLQNESPLTFKLDHKTENKQMRSVAWDLAYNQFKPQDWKRLAHNWQFTDSQIAAIEEQWTGPNSYQEHGNRMLLIWLHGTLAANENPGKVIYEGLISIGCKSMAEKTRIDTNGNNSKKCTVS